MPSRKRSIETIQVQNASEVTNLARKSEQDWRRSLLSATESTGREEQFRQTQMSIKLEFGGGGSPPLPPPCPLSAAPYVLSPIGARCAKRVKGGGAGPELLTSAPFSSSLSPPSLELSVTHVYQLKYEPFSEPLHISAGGQTPSFLPPRPYPVATSPRMYSTSSIARCAVFSCSP